MELLLLNSNTVFFKFPPPPPLLLPLLPIFHKTHKWKWKSYACSISGTQSPIPSPTSESSLSELLKSSCGFPPEEAEALESKVKNKKKNPKDIESAQNVIQFFRDAGFSNTHIRKIVSMKPRLLNSNVEKTLKPKIKALEDLGLSRHEIRDTIVGNMYYLQRNPDSLIGFLSSFFENKEDVAVVIKKLRFHASFASSGIELDPRVSKYREHGVSKEKLISYAVKYPRLITMKPEVIEEKFQKAYQMGFKQGDSMLFLAVKVVSCVKTSTWESKLQLLRSYGWKESEISMAFRKAPLFMASSLRKMKRILKFFMDDLKYEPFELASHSPLLNLSLDKRIIPRHDIIKEMESRGLLKRKGNLFTILNRSEDRFQSDYLLAIRGDHPDLFESYLKRIGKV